MKEKSLTLNLNGLQKFCETLSLNLKKGDIICLFGELGSGKTTFSRYLIQSIYKSINEDPPEAIKSPSFPILLTYNLNNYEIFHYDLYRITSKNDLSELNIFEELNSSITLIEWPDKILDLLENYKYYSVKFNILDKNKRNIKHNFNF